MRLGGLHPLFVQFLGLAQLFLRIDAQVGADHLEQGSGLDFDLRPDSAALGTTFLLLMQSSGPHELERQMGHDRVAKSFPLDVPGRVKVEIHFQ